jgi:hypothetical protein
MSRSGTVQHTKMKNQNPPAMNTAIIRARTVAISVVRDVIEQRMPTHANVET